MGFFCKYLSHSEHPVTKKRSWLSHLSFYCIVTQSNLGRANGELCPIAATPAPTPIIVPTSPPTVATTEGPSVVPTAAPTMATNPPVVPTVPPSMTPSDGMMSMPSDGMMSMDMGFDLDEMMNDEFGRAAGNKSKKTYIPDNVSVSAVCFIKSVLYLGLFPHSSLFLICPSATR
jgi:hypothetical protein